MRFLTQNPPPKRVKPNLARAVQSWYGVVWESRSSYHRLLAQCGFTWQRTEKVYKSRRESAVMDFEAYVEKN